MSLRCFSENTLKRKELGSLMLTDFLLDCQCTGCYYSYYEVSSTANAEVHIHLELQVVP